MSQQYDLVVIGAGPGGYEAALAAAAKGMHTALVEKGKLGGTCLNCGCIPTKTLLHTAEAYREAASEGAPGLSVSGISLDMPALQRRKDRVCAELRDGIAGLLAKAKVDVYQAAGRILDAGKVLLETGDGDQVLTCEKILIATGSKPSVIPIPGLDLPGVVDSEALLAKEELFDQLVIVGGGVIGMEFASIYSDFGRPVIVLEAMDRILPGMDREIAQNLKLILKKRGVDIHAGAFVKGIEESPEGGLICRYEEKGVMKEAHGDGCLIAVGRRANASSLFTEASSEAVRAMKLEREAICVDEKYETSVPGIYAIGDVTAGGIQLAHAASAAAKNCVAQMAGGEPKLAANLIASCVYTSPEIASVGISPDDAKKQKLAVISKKYPMSANGKSVLSGQERGFIKITADKDSRRVLGAQLMCANATDMIALFAAAIANEMTVDQLAKTVFPHPTFSEGIGEALAAFAE